MEIDVIKVRKNNKRPGVDIMLNEFMRYSQRILLPSCAKLFNKILDANMTGSTVLLRLYAKTKEMFMTLAAKGESLFLAELGNYLPPY